MSKAKRACRIDGKPCKAHDRVHGKEAEELRAGIEKLLKHDGEDSLPDLVDDLRLLLDRTDARDSLAYLEATDTHPEDPQ